MLLVLCVAPLPPSLCVFVVFVCCLLCVSSSCLMLLFLHTGTLCWSPDVYLKNRLFSCLVFSCLCVSPVLPLIFVTDLTWSSEVKISSPWKRVSVGRSPSTDSPIDLCSSVSGPNSELQLKLQQGEGRYEVEELARNHRHGPCGTEVQVQVGVKPPGTKFRPVLPLILGGPSSSDQNPRTHDELSAWDLPSEKTNWIQNLKVGPDVLWWKSLPIIWRADPNPQAQTIRMLRRSALGESDQ